MGGDSKAGLRADARRNQEKLVAAATDVFTERGVDASLEEVARRAGVGIGTLYRHFPSRDALIATVYRRETEALAEAATELARSLPPDEALGRWMQRSLDYMATKRGLGDSLRLLLQQQPDLAPSSQDGLLGQLQRLVEAARAAGSIRPDAEAADIIHVISGLYSLPNTPDWRARSGRVLGMLMEGLRRHGEG